MCGEDECGGDDCIWSPNSGEWYDGVCTDGACEHDGSECSTSDSCGYNLGQCGNGCDSDNCWACKADYYGFEEGSDEEIALCEDAGCFHLVDTNCWDNGDEEICEENFACVDPCVSEDGTDVHCDACDEDTCEQHGCLWMDTNIVDGNDCGLEANYECFSPCGNSDDWDSEDNEGEPRPECSTCKYLGAVEDYCADAGCSLSDDDQVSPCGESYMSCSN
jgi:hypothetical protein